MLLDEVLPEYTIHSHHERHVDAPPGRVYAALKTLQGNKVGLMSLLMAIRTLPARIRGQLETRDDATVPTLEAMVAWGFIPLAERDGEEIVIGFVGKPWRPQPEIRRDIHDLTAFHEFAEPDNVKVAFNMRVQADDGGTRLSTETRIRCLDREAERKFRRYWRVVGIGSGLIRVMWLRAIARRALVSPA